MAFVELMKHNYLKNIISQNIDGLHLKSGIPESKIFELHGNTNLEQCQKCDKKYLRNYKVRTERKLKEHATGRLCDDTAC